MNYEGLAFPKPEPRVIAKLRAKKWDAKNERACREITRKRDLGKCRIPGCSEHATELHPHRAAVTVKTSEMVDIELRLAVQIASPTAARWRDSDRRRCGCRDYRDG